MAVFAGLGARAQTVRHVWRNSPNPNAGDGYLTWGTAATNIQNAIDASNPGDLVWVTNGVYNASGRTAPAVGAGTNRVVVDKVVTVRSVNGPSNTFIVGRWHIVGDTNNIFGPNAVRCVYITNNAVLAGFTLTNGVVISNVSAAAYNGGGAWCQSTNAILSNCVIIACYSRQGGGIYRGMVYNSVVEANYAGFGGAGVDSAILRGCSIMGNSAGWGAGARASHLYNCELVANTGGYGGGALDCRLYECLLASNSIFIAGGGSAALDCTLYGCAVTGNGCPTPGGSPAVARQAGQVSTLYNCVLFANSGGWGGAANGSTLYNCLMFGNYAGRGGGAAYSTLYNCTVIGNSAAQEGGGIYVCTNWNSIVYNNIAVQPVAAPSNNYFESRFFYSCSSPLPAGASNTDADPMLVNSGSNYGLSHVYGDYRLAIGSPCVNTGTNFTHMSDPAVLATNKWLGLDVEGQPRLRGQVDMGAYEQYIVPGTVFIIRGK